MDDAKVAEAIGRLQAAAKELGQALRRANQLPERFPEDYVAELLQHVDEIDGADADSIRLATHLRDKVLQTADAYKTEDAAFLKSLHNDLFLEVSRFLKVTNASRDYPQFEARKGRAQVAASDNREQLERVIAETVAALRDAAKAEQVVHKFVQQKGLINVGDITLGGIKIDIEFTLIKARKALAALLLELKADIIDLEWVSDFVRFVGHCNATLGTAIERLDSKFRASPIVSAILSFLARAVVLTEHVRAFLGSVIPPEQPEPEPNGSGVEPGQVYHQVGSSALWQVEAVALPSGDPREIFHARLVALGTWHGRQEKTLGVTVLRDHRFWRQVQRKKTT